METQVIVRDFRDRGWTLEFCRTGRTLGRCWGSHKIIEISKPYLERINPIEMLDTLRHEFAHAAVYEAGLSGPGEDHGTPRKAFARAFNCRPTACKPIPYEQRPTPKWVKICPTCGSMRPYYRKPRKVTACPDCCKKCADGAFQSKYKFSLVRYPHRKLFAADNDIMLHYPEIEQ